jgi:hypothetical protein
VVNIFGFFGGNDCTIDDIRVCSGFGSLISPNGGVEREVEWSYVDTNGNPTDLDCYVSRDGNNHTPDYRCVSCSAEFWFWGDVLQHVKGGQE